MNIIGPFSQHLGRAEALGRRFGPPNARPNAAATRHSLDWAIGERSSRGEEVDLLPAPEADGLALRLPLVRAEVK